MDQDLERLERERLEADRRYNDGLTSLDAAIMRPVAAPLVPSAPPAARDLTALADITTPAPALPSRWQGGKWLETVWAWLTPVFARQREVNAQVAAQLHELDARAEADRTALRQTTAHLDERFAALERFQSALVVYAQQITGFVESKDRQIIAGAEHRLQAHDAALAVVPELQERVALLQRTTQMLRREVDLIKQAPAAAAQGQAVGSTPPAAAASVPAVAATDNDFKYVGFEDRFRGSVEDIRTKLRSYLPLFAGSQDVLDVGCGRGEFIALLESEGIRARGIDLNHEMVQVARDRGLNVEHADALAYLSSLPDESLGGLIAAQVVEHLDPTYLMRLLDVAFHKLRPGSAIVLETINPACWLAFFSSYIRDMTHSQPVHPDTLQYLLQASGFVRVAIQYSAPVPDEDKLKVLDLPAEMFEASDVMSKAMVDASRIININALKLNYLLFSYFDYAAIGYRA